MTLREELLEMIGHLPETALEALAPAIRAQDARYTPADWRVALERVRAFRGAMLARYGGVPDAATLVSERQAARMRDILPDAEAPPLTVLPPEGEPPEVPRAAA